MPAPKEFNLDDLQAYMERVEASGVFGRSKRRLRLLSHLIHSELEGQGDRLKAYSIGLDIFDKSADFDPASDSVVRVEMGRLRSAIALFEASEFADTRMVVDIPVGSYRPAMSLRTSSAQPTSAQIKNPEPTRIMRKPIWLGFAALVIGVVLFLGFFLQRDSSPATGLTVQVSTADQDDPHVQVMKSQLMQALSRSKAIGVVDGDASKRNAAAFEIRLRHLHDEQGVRLLTDLVETETGQIIWGHATVAADDAALADSIENQLARELRVRVFGASKAFLQELDPKDMSPEALFVLATWVPGPAESTIVWEEKRIEFAKMALKQDPAFGSAHSVLADKLAYLANVYAPADTSENRKAALNHAQRAMDLSPLDPDVMFNVAQAHWHSGRIAESHGAMGRVIELDASHDLARFLHQMIPYTCATAPDEIVEWATDFDANLSPDNPIRWLTLTWIGWLHAYRAEWDEALVAEEAAARIFQIPYTFMRRAMVLHQLGRTEEAINVIEMQNTNWAAFDPQHYIAHSIPRLCQETPNPKVFVTYYQDLAEALRNPSRD